jgi:hypothetical protein
MIHIPVASFALLATAGIFIAIVVHGFETGEPRTKHQAAARPQDLVAFWAAQIFHAIFALACLFAALAAITEF